MALSKIIAVAVAGAAIGTAGALTAPPVAASNGAFTPAGPPATPTPFPGCSGAGTDSCQKPCANADHGSYYVQSAGYYACSGGSCVDVSCTQKNFTSLNCVTSSGTAADTSFTTSGCK